MDGTLFKAISLDPPIRANISVMIERVLLVAWKGSAATAWVETLKSGGYTVLLEDTTGERAWRTAKERGIDVVIIDGQKKPSHGRQTGHALRDTAKTRNIPIIWTNLDTEDTASVQAEVKPDVTLIAPTDAVSALAALQTLHTLDATNDLNAITDAVPRPLESSFIVVAPPLRSPEIETSAELPLAILTEVRKVVKKSTAAKRTLAKKPTTKKPAKRR
jgi:CheY-like chemotaxis protein